ncbi:beta-N-acetylhexosaminidase [Nonomuraea rubra]
MTALDLLVPLPLRAERLPGAFEIGPDTTIGADGAALDSAWLLHDILAGTGLRLPLAPSAPITLRVDGTGAPEGYRITVTGDGVELVGGTADGLARAVQTFRQLLPASALRRAGPGASIRIDGCRIEDEPRFSWRGVHLDVARHFMPKSFVLKLIDLAALHRLNVLHLHLTDDQGWRFEVPGRPRLTEVAAWRPETLGDGTPHGGYYTLGDLREIVAYAARRRITVVPEVDLPGHMQAALAAYPQLGNTGRPIEVMREWGISEHVLAPTKEALAFTREVLDVVLDVFPGPWVHLGGDECPRTEWQESGAAAALGLGSAGEIQSWFMRELHAYVAGRGRRVVGWDEVLADGGMPADTVVMAWQDARFGVEATRAGHDVVMCPKTVCYFDHYQSGGPDEPPANGGLTLVEDVAAWEPVPPGAVPGRILGVQGQLWTEYLPTPQAVEYMAFPRLSALAEVGWTARTRRDASDLMRRLRGHEERLDALGVNHRPLDGPLPWQRRPLSAGAGPRRPAAL